jgi:hypothetical protein
MTLPAREVAMGNAIRGILGTIGASPTLSSALTNKGYIYSAYVSTLIVDGLNRERWVIRKPVVENPRGGPFRFPMGRSEIYSSIPSWFSFGTAAGEWEIHLCCNCSGASGMQHELDILVLDAQIAHDCRQNQRQPAVHEVVFLVECKNVGAVDYSLGREFIGLCFEFPILSTLAQNMFGRQQWSWRGAQSLAALVATLPTLSGRPSAFRLVSARNLIAHPWVEPRIQLLSLHSREM